MPWQEWIRTVEVEPSLYGADFANLGEQIETLMRADCRIFHFDVGDGHFVEPITMGPIVLESIAPLIHGLDGKIDVHLMVDEPAKHFAAVAAAGGDSVTFHIEAVDDVRATIRAAREQELQVGIAFNPETEPEAVVEFADAVDLVLCMSINPGYSGQEFQAEAYERVRRLRASLPESVRDPGRRRGQGSQRQAALRRGCTTARRSVGDLRPRGSDAGLSPARAAAAVSIGGRCSSSTRPGRAGIRSRPSARSSSATARSWERV